MTSPQDYWGRLKPRLDRCKDHEGRLNLLRIFTRECQKECREADLAGRLPLPDLFEELTALAEAVMRGSLETAGEGMKERGRGDFAIIGMGKFGGRELTYRSDLDIIYLYEDPEDQDVYTRLGTRIISVLTVVTQEGTAYAIDAALRPSGNRGTLVSSLPSFREYHRTMGRTWERQSLIKARALLGRPDRGSDFGARVKNEIEGIVYQDYDPRMIASEIDHLRGRMEREIGREKPGRYDLKTGRGGLVDIEFVVQYLQLVHGKKDPNLRTSNTILAIRALENAKILETALAERLLKSYLFLRWTETRLRLFLDQPADVIVEAADWYKALAGRFLGGKDFLPQLLKTREEVRSIYERVMQQ